MFLYIFEDTFQLEKQNKRVFQELEDVTGRSQSVREAKLELEAVKSKLKGQSVDQASSFRETVQQIFSFRIFNNRT